MTGTNPNIEVINDHLWAVNFYYVRYIDDLTYHCDDHDALDKPASITNDGVIILNKSHEIYPILKNLISRIMESTDYELMGKLDYMKDKDRDGYDRFYKLVLETEVKRRSVEKQHKGQLKGKSPLKRLLNFIGLNSKERR